MKSLKADSPNSFHIRSLLNSFTEELSLTFLERRGKLNNHKSTLLEELQDVINELTHREKDLQTAVQVGLSALDSVDKLQMKNSSLKAKLDQANEKLYQQSIEIKTLQDSLVVAESKYENINKTLIETEELMLENSAELNRMVRERFRETSCKASDEDLELITREYKQQVDSLQKKRWELEKLNNQLVSINSVQEIDLNEFRSNNEKLEAKLQKTLQSLKDLEKSHQDLSSKLETSESQLLILRAKYEKVKNQNEKLEEDLSLPSTQAQQNKPKLSHTLSLQSELDSIYELHNLDDSMELHIKTQEDESLEDILYLSPHKCKTPQTRTSSLTSHTRLWSTDSASQISISPERLPRKKPPEEYFALAVQAVKMNSPYIDNIITISASDLYQAALRLGVPFHKWHIWIESQLNTIYVQTLYKKNKKTLWRRYSGKMCLGR